MAFFTRDFEPTKSKWVKYLRDWPKMAGEPKKSENILVDLYQKSDILERELWFEFFAFVELCSIQNKSPRKLNLRTDAQ